MIGFECRIANSALENLVHEAMLEAIPDQEMDVNGFAITLKILGSPTIQAENKSIAIALPLGINFSRQAGTIHCARSWQNPRKNKIGF